MKKKVILDNKIKFSKELKDYVKDVANVKTYQNKIENYISKNVLTKIPKDDYVGVLPENLHRILTAALPERIYTNFKKLVVNEYFSQESHNYAVDEFEHDAIVYFEMKLCRQVIIPFVTEEGYEFDYDPNFDFYKKGITDWENYSNFKHSIIYLSNGKHTK